MLITLRKSALFLFCFLLLFSMTQTWAQYSRAEIDRAVNYLTDRGMLQGIVALTTQDRTKLTSRPDVLMACYEIMRELDSIEAQLSARTNSIDQRVNEIRTMVTRGGGANVEYDALVTKVLNEVEKGLPDSREALQAKQSLESLQAQNVRIERDLKALRTALIKAEPGLVNAAELRKRTKQNRTIAITGVVVSAVIAILAAR